jgi:hypothetical protein
MPYLAVFWRIAERTRAQLNPLSAELFSSAEMLCALSQEIKGAAGSSALVLDNKVDRRDSKITSQNAPAWICCAIPDFDPSK